MVPERCAGSFSCRGECRFITNKQPNVELMNTTMNAMDITEEIPQESTTASITNATRDKAQALGLAGRARLRRGALLGLVLMLGWLAYSVQSSLNSIETELDLIHAKLQAK